MFRYIVNRIIIMPIMLLFVTLLLYLVINISPTDPAIALLPSEFTQEDVEKIHEEYGFNKPVIVQYGNWLVKAVTGDWGTSYQTSLPISKEIQSRLPVSIKLGVFTIIVVMLVGVPLGIVCAVKQYTIFDDAINIGAKTLGGIPTFLYIVILTFIFTLKLDWFPSYGLTSVKHWILPIIAGAIPPIGGMIRQTRSAMLDCIRKDYIYTARSKGIPERTIIFKEALRNAMLPIITMIGGMLSMLIGGAVVTENVFAIPGIGAYTVTAVQYKDTPAIMGSAVILAVFFMVLSLLVDIGYAVADPRTKATFLKAKKIKRSKPLQLGRTAQ